MINEEVQTMLTEDADIVATPYRASHGKHPRGTGNWAFQLRKRKNDTDGEMFWPSANSGPMRYTEALKLAQQAAKESGANYIYVMP